MEVINYPVPVLRDRIDSDLKRYRNTPTFRMTAGARALIIGGITIAESSVIGAGAIVLKSVPKNTRVLDTYK
jgi:serine acetyltransferase